MQFQLAFLLLILGIAYSQENLDGSSKDEELVQGHLENYIMKRSTDNEGEREYMEESMGKRSDEELSIPLEEESDEESDIEHVYIAKRSMAIGRPSLRPGKRSVAMGRLAFRPGKRAIAVSHLSSYPIKRSVASGRLGFRPGKRSLSMGRVNFRPGKRSVAMGRMHFRPGKRSIAAGRINFRPGKRAVVNDILDYCMFGYCGIH